MHEAEMNMQRRKKDNFEQLIELFPFDPNKDSTVFSSDMDTIINKASLGLQIHDPRTKWADDLYLLMGKAYYFKGDYDKAGACFKYIIGMNKALKLKPKKKIKEADDVLIKKEKSKFNKFFKHQPAKNDAILWLTRTYTDQGKVSEAEAILDLIDASATLSEKMKAKVALERANLSIRNRSYTDASKQLGNVSRSKIIRKYTRQRASFINGQLQYEIGQNDSAAISFKRNLSLHPPIEMDFYARKYGADAVALSGGNQSKTIASLKRLLKDGKYVNYHEQVYFVLGRLSANDDKYEDALNYYKKSLTQPKTTPKQKAISFASIGNIQYKMGDFNLAKTSFDSASYFAKNIKGNQEIELAIKRALSLSKIEEPYLALRVNDSLLKLSKLSEKEQKAVVKKYLKYLDKQKQDSIANALAASTSGSLANTSNSNTMSSWYFGSPVAVQQGYNEFKRKWGNRTLKDNWRRSSAANFGEDNKSNNSDADEEATENSNVLTEDGLLDAIPKTELELKRVHKNIKRAYLNLAKTYIKDLEEFKDGLATLDSLNSHYPNHEFQDEELSIRYIAALRQGNLELSESIRQNLLNNYPNSLFALELKTNEANDTLNTQSLKTEPVASYYESTYNLTIDHQYKEVIQRVAVAKRIYGDPSYSRKFRVLEAESFASIGNYKKADSLVADYIKENPSDSLRPWIDAIMRSIEIQKSGDTLAKDSTSVLKSSLSKTIDSTAKKADLDSLMKIPKAYLYEPKEPHYCIFVFGKAESKVAGFRSGLTDFSTIRFSGLILNTEIDILNPDQSMVISKGFASSGQSKIFMNSASLEKLLFREMEANSYQYFIISEKNFIRLKAEKKLDNYLIFYKKNYK
jgi:tetratricopeptide (TPR) repeat protein